MTPQPPTGLDEAIQAGRPRHVDNLALCTQPGIFSWDRLDPGTALLLRPAPRPAFSVLGHEAWSRAGVAPIGDWRDRLNAAMPSLREAW